MNSDSSHRMTFMKNSRGSTLKYLENLESAASKAYIDESAYLLRSPAFGVKGVGKVKYGNAM